MLGGRGHFHRTTGQYRNPLGNLDLSSDFLCYTLYRRRRIVVTSGVRFHDIMDTTV